MNSSIQKRSRHLFQKHQCRSKLYLVTVRFRESDYLLVEGLQVGDIIRLDTKVDQELSVFVGSIKKFTALPGETGNDYAVRITSVIREEQ